MVAVKENIDWETAYTVHGMLHAMMIREALESAGIPVQLSYKSVPAVGHEWMALSDDVRVLVPQEWYKEVVTLLTT